MMGHPAMPCSGGVCIQRLDASKLKAMLWLRKRPAYRTPFALFSLGGGYLA